MVPGGDFEYLALFHFKIFTPTIEMKKLKSGFLLKEILDRFIAKTQAIRPPDYSLYMYFAHDNTIANMLNSLGLYSVRIEYEERFYFVPDIVTFLYFSCINRRTRRAFSLSCMRQIQFHMYKYFIRIPVKQIFQPLKFPIVAKNVH